MSTLVCFAVKEEAAGFRKSAAAARVDILLTGMGAANAGKSFRAALAANRPAVVLTCGFAGGLNPQLVTGDVVFEISRSRGDETQIKKELETPYVVSYEKLIAAGARAGKFHCAARVAGTAAEKAALWHQTGADAVEMESQIIREICRAEKIPAATIRVILDPAGEDLPLDFNALLTPDLKMDFGRLALAIAKSPGKIGGLRRLQKQSRAAAAKLATALQAVLA